MNFLSTVDYALSELRRGHLIVIFPISVEDDLLLVQAAETITLQSISNYFSRPSLALTVQRAATLGLFRRRIESVEPGSVVLIQASPYLNVDTVLALARPGAIACSSTTLETLSVTLLPGSNIVSTAIYLVKLARLLPSAIITFLKKHQRYQNIAMYAAIKEEDIKYYNIRALRQVSEAQVPLAGAENTRLIAFRPQDGGIEHIAVIIGYPDNNRAVLVRLHSECFTGDLLGSLRCDCGDQLRGAINAIATAGGGILLYLSQEGRGIGLVNKLRAYQLQDHGFDTLEANKQLGFDDDERIYLPAAEILRQLSFNRVRLMTNNPRKVEALARHGVEVIERIPHTFQANHYNLSYLQTKVIKCGHLF